MNKTSYSKRNRFVIGIFSFVMLIMSLMMYGAQISRVSLHLDGLFFPENYPIVGGIAIFDWLLFGSALFFSLGFFLLAFIYSAAIRVRIAIISACLLAFVVSFVVVINLHPSSVLRIFLETFMTSLLSGAYAGMVGFNIKTILEKSK
jgi:hypothetical protein